MTREQFNRLRKKFGILREDVSAVMNHDGHTISVMLDHFKDAVPDDMELILLGMIVKCHGFDELLTKASPATIELMKAAAKHEDNIALRNVINELNQRDSIMAMMQAKKKG